jgi:hypothetical protein
LVFRRYWKTAEETFERPEKMTTPKTSATVQPIVLTSQEHLPRVEVEQIQAVTEETDEGPVEQRQEKGTGDGVVRGDVGENGDLRVKGDTVGPNESVEQRGDGTFGKPLSEGLEKQLGTSISVLLPSIELRD